MEMNIKAAVAQNYIKEVLDFLSQHTNNSTDVIMQQARYHGMVRERNNGLMTPDRADMIMAKIRNSLLYIIDDKGLGNLNVEIANSSSSNPSGTLSQDEKTKILFLGVNPKGGDQLRLGQEIRDLVESIKRSKFRDKFQFSPRLAVTTDLLKRGLLEEEPNIVHFSGHGEEEGLYFEDEIGMPKLIKTSSLSALFKVFNRRSKIDCVVLNACFSEPQAKAINEHIKYVIGMKSEIPDESAISFTKGFYDSLGAGDGIETAFEIGRLSIQLDDVAEEDLPVLFVKKEE